MEDKKSNWKDTCNRFVAFLDIMGFKDMVLKSGHSEILNTLRLFSSAVRANEIIDEEKSSIKKNIKTVVFSDSIIVITRDGSKQSALDIINHIGWIIMFSAVQSIPIKGAIAYGEQTVDSKNSLYFGMPLINAYELHNELLMYGVILHNTMEKRLIDTKTMTKIEDDWIFKYEVPMRAGKITHYVVDWRPDSIKTEHFPNLYLSVSGAPRRYVDNTIKCGKWIIERKQSKK